MKPRPGVVAGSSLGLAMSVGVLLALRATGAEPLEAFTGARGGFVRSVYAVLAMGLILVLAVVLRNVGPSRELLPNRTFLVSASGTLLMPFVIACLWSAYAGGTMSDVDVMLGPVLLVYQAVALLLGLAWIGLAPAGTGHGSRFVRGEALALFPLSVGAYFVLRTGLKPGLVPIMGALVLAVPATVITGSEAITAGPRRVVLAVAFVCACTILGSIAVGQ